MVGHSKWLSFRQVAPSWSITLLIKFYGLNQPILRSINKAASALVGGIVPAPDEEIDNALIDN